MRIILTQSRAAGMAAAHRLAGHLRATWQRAKAEPDAGYTTESAIVTALLVLLAIGAVGVIASKVMDKVNGLQF